MLSCSGSTVKLSGSSSRYETKYRWNVDGSISTRSSVTTTYATDGPHVVILKVTGPGGSDTAYRTVTTPCP